MRGRGLVLAADFADLVLDQSLLQRRSRAAGPFDVLKQRPGRAAEFFGQIFDAARARALIGHFGEVGFLKQQQLRVARDPPRETVGQTRSPT